MPETVAAAQPRWSIAPYFIVDDVVATANYYRDTLGFAYEGSRDICDQPYGCRDFDVEDCNGYRLCFGHNIEG